MFSLFHNTLMAFVSIGSHPRRTRRRRAAPPRMATPDVWSYTALVDHVTRGDVASVSVTPDAVVRAIGADGVAHVSQLLPAQLTPLMESMARRGIDVGVVSPSVGTLLLEQVYAFLPLVLLTWFVASVFQRTGMPGMLARMNPQGRSAMEAVDDVETTFEDVAGLASAKEELFEIVEYLRSPETFASYGARVPRGVLLEGPPGTGKTLLARAVAGEANATFIPTTASSFVEMYVGLGAARVRALFERARERAPCIVWIDEIDAIARKRGGGGGGGGGGTEERETTLNELLSAMDGFAESSGVIVLAATNRADVLDDALLRPGRFDRRVPVTLPDLNEREDILRVHARNKRIGDDVDLSVVARLTPGFSGAELSNVMNEAAIRTMRRRAAATSMDDVQDAIERATVGLRGSTRSVPADVRERVAVHESGHAIVGSVLEAYDEVVRVTIVPRSSGAGGFTSFLSTEERGTEGLFTRDYLVAQLCVLLAGRAAEAHVLGEETISVGASSDIRRAQRLAERMVVEWGMGGERVLPPREARGAITLERIDREVEALMDEAYTLALSIVSDRRSQLLRLTRHLIDVCDTVDGDFVRALTAPTPP